jgi:hypothetical protein
MPGQHETRLRKVEAIVVGAVFLLLLVGYLVSRIFGFGN